MSSTPHPFAPEEIMAQVDGELSAVRAESVSTHLDSCADCRTLLQEFQQTKCNVAMWQVASLPAAIEGRIESAAATASSPSATTSPEIFRRRSLWPRTHWIGGLAATAAAAFLVLSFFSLSKLKPASAPVDFARVNSVRKSKAPAAAPQSTGDGLTLAQRMSANASDNGALYSYAPASGLILEKTQSDLATNRIPLQERSRNPIAGAGRTEPMIARTVSLALIARDFDSSRGSLDAILARHNGYAASLSVATPQDAARSLQASLRIPASQLAAAILELRALGRVELENQNGEEVTQQHADLLARLKNSRETEQRLQAILTQRTGKISDVLEVEQEIARVRGEIEQMEAEQKNLEHRVDFATIDLKLSEEYKAKIDSPAPAISILIHNAAVNGYRNIADTLLSIVLFFAEYGPVLCFWFIVFFIPSWLVWRRWRHATAAA
jgi:anti-sigma factor RsiW